MAETHLIIAKIRLFQLRRREEDWRKALNASKQHWISFFCFDFFDKISKWLTHCSPFTALAYWKKVAPVTLVTAASLFLFTFKNCLGISLNFFLQNTVEIVNLSIYSCYGRQNRQNAVARPVHNHHWNRRYQSIDSNGHLLTYLLTYSLLTGLLTHALFSWYALVRFYISLLRSPAVLDLSLYFDEC